MAKKKKGTSRLPGSKKKPKRLLPPPPRQKSGRPRKNEEHLTIEADKPWVRLEVSRRTYYRWKRLLRKL
jgi:hypothetical protein